MNHRPGDPHTIPLKALFPYLQPEERQAMRDFLDGYCEVAWQVWERLEGEPGARNIKIGKVVDIIKKGNPTNPL
jgi:hypothetical protein